MPEYREIRADFDREGIVVSQGSNDAIADAAMAAGRFVAPFSFNRMTWIKPSFLWLMERSGWGTKPNQTRILAVRMSREGWKRALELGILTAFEPGAHRSLDDWRSRFDAAQVHVQWDPERPLHGKKLEYRAIQVGIGRTLIGEYVSEWIVEIRDLTETTAKIRRLRQSGHYDKAKRLLPREAPYPVDPAVARRLGMQSRA
ncbi:MAG: DUF4291 domain-containing protein [Planctomycetaceae bacterium]